MKQVMLNFIEQFKGLDKSLSFATMKVLTPPAPSSDRAGFSLLYERKKKNLYTN